MFINILFSLFAFFAPVDSNSEYRADLNETIKEIESEKCMDRLMTNWFIYFNQAQERGHEMQRADEIAANIALERHQDNCSH